MTFQELTPTTETVTFLAIRPAGARIGLLLKLGRLFPTTKAQAVRFVNSASFDCFTYSDAEIIEAFLQKHGFSGDYRYTKSGRFLNLNNMHAFRNALMLEFNF